MKALLSFVVALVVGSGLIPARVSAQVGTLVIAHGGGPEWDAQVRTVAAQVNTGGPVEVSFLMGPGAKTAPFQSAAKKLVDAGAKEIVVVPVLVSSHSGHYDQIRYLAGLIDSIDETMMHHLHMGGIERAAVNVPIRVAAALDNAPEMAVVLAERARAAAAEPASQALFLIGHGSNSAEDHAAWMANLRPVADSVKSLTGFRSVLIGLVRDDAPAAVRAEAVRSAREMIQLQAAVTGRDVVVIPILISRGQVSEQKIPADLQGLPIRYAPVPLLPHPQIARWIEKRVRDVSVAATPARDVSGASGTGPGHSDH
ncbi:MAG TPA: CbiX/SirB N-terminal domain-containing protein [Longimicrobiales bacterium]